MNADDKLIRKIVRSRRFKAAYDGINDGVLSAAQGAVNAASNWALSEADDDGAEKEFSNISNFASSVESGMSSDDDSDGLQIVADPKPKHPAVTNKVIPLHAVHENLRSGRGSDAERTAQYTEYMERAHKELGCSAGGTALDQAIERGLERSRYLNRVGILKAENAYEERFKNRS